MNYSYELEQLFKRIFFVYKNHSDTQPLELSSQIMVGGFLRDIIIVYNNNVMFQIDGYSGITLCIGCEGAVKAISQYRARFRNHHVMDGFAVFFSSTNYKINDFIFYDAEADTDEIKIRYPVTEESYFQASTVYGVPMDFSFIDKLMKLEAQSTSDGADSLDIMCNQTSMYFDPENFANILNSIDTLIGYENE